MPTRERGDSGSSEDAEDKQQRVEPPDGLLALKEDDEQAEHSPTNDRPRSTRRGLRPPVVSTHAENGMRSSDPDRFGMDTSSPAAAGVSLAAVVRNFAVGPKSATAAKPMKKPSVAPHRPIAGVPRTCNVFSP